MFSPSNAYEYDELADGAFRYLILYPGTNSDPLKCSLHTSFIDEVRFESVSYVWGTDKRDHDIICDGKLLKITPNLHNVLQQVRLPDAPRNLWADSICINQEDLVEKGRQVAIMGQIYRAAERVLICMGSSGEEHGPNVLSLLKDVCEMIDVGVAVINETIKQLEEDDEQLEEHDEWDPDWRPWNHFPHPDAYASVLSDHRWVSVNVLVQQDWFKRGWVVREAGLAREGLVIWGQTEFSWDLLMRTLVWRHRRAINTIEIPYEDCFRSHLEAYEAQHQDTICVFYQESSWKACSLLDYIHFARTLRLTDPRDRIYAFLDLADESRHQLNVIPNYSDTPSKVYRDFATHYICTTGDVNILHYVKHDAESLKSGFMTWAPQWNMRPDNLRGFVLPNDDHPALTSRTMQTYKPKLLDSGTLHVKGVIVDSVQCISGVLQDTTTTAAVLFELWKMVAGSTAQQPYATCYLLEAFFDTLSMSGLYGDQSEWYRCREAYMKLFTRLSILTHESEPITWDTDEIAKLESNMFHGIIASMTSGKRVIVTKRGYIGFGPAVTQEGDLCGIIFGYPYPCLLRNTSSEARYVYLGSSYLLGKTMYDNGSEGIAFWDCLGVEGSKDWTEWDVEEQDIYLC